jgi:transcriptional regulator with XRE-family HTH domain
MSAIDLSQFLQQRADTLNFSATYVANKAGISRQTWYRLVNADVQQARISTLMRVANTLQVSLIELSCLYNKKKYSAQKSIINTMQDSDAYVFIRDVSYPLNTMVGKGERFKKTWEFFNAGNTPWVNRRFICVDNKFDINIKHPNSDVNKANKNNFLTPLQRSVEVPTTAPGEHLLLSVQFRAPDNTGTMVSLWKTVNAQGNYCYPKHEGSSCQVRVVERSLNTININDIN